MLFFTGIATVCRDGTSACLFLLFVVVFAAYNFPSVLYPVSRPAQATKYPAYFTSASRLMHPQTCFLRFPRDDATKNLLYKCEKVFSHQLTPYFDVRSIATIFFCTDAVSYSFLINKKSDCKTLCYVYLVFFTVLCSKNLEALCIFENITFNCCT